jgi:hypothetical protein
LNDNPRPDYFAMMHADVCAAPGWLDTLVEEIEREDVEMVSSIIAIKDATDRTSTCIYDPTIGKGENIKRSEVSKYPPTFGNEILPAGQHLLLNTGLWICKFKDAKKILVNNVDVVPWVEAFSFGQTDQIYRREDGMYDALATTEDWQMTLWMQGEGLSYKVTSKIPILHVGTAEWTTHVDTPQPDSGLGAWEPANSGIRSGSPSVTPAGEKAAE